MIEIVAYSPKNKNLEEKFNNSLDKVNSLNNSFVNKGISKQVLSKSRQERSADWINNLYFEFHSNDESGEFNDYSNVVFCGKSTSN